MGTNKQLLSKGIKYLAGALPLLFIGPSLIYNAFMNQQNVALPHFSYRIVACLAAMFYMYMGLKIIMKGLTTNGRAHSYSKNF
jgi:putative Mn2+ efflux pump MntP